MRNADKHVAIFLKYLEVDDRNRIWMKVLSFSLFFYSLAQILFCLHETAENRKVYSFLPNNTHQFHQYDSLLTASVVEKEWMDERKKEDEENIHIDWANLLDCKIN